jgi:hypothetical protein
MTKEEKERERSRRIEAKMKEYCANYKGGSWSWVDEFTEVLKPVSNRPTIDELENIYLKTYENGPSNRKRALADIAVKVLASFREDFPRKDLYEVPKVVELITEWIDEYIKEYKDSHD